MIRTFDIPSREAERHLARLSRRARFLFDGPASRTAEQALVEIRAEGDLALARWRRRHDGVRGGVRAVFGRETVSRDFRRAFDESLRRLTAFHSRQAARGARWSDGGTVVAERVVPLDSVAAYVPGGEAVYVSTALMTILPAKIAGVRRVVVATPPAAWDGSAELRWALRRLEVDEVYRMGGAHAIAALAVGTAAIPSVAKICGPGNRWVTAAKRAVAGLAGIESLAGPTEVAIFADGAADPRRVAADLLAQAEHDSSAAAILVTTSRRLAAAVRAEIPGQLRLLSTRARAAASLRRYGAVAVASSAAAGVRWIERFAPEHLGIHTERSSADASKFRRAGAIFAGGDASEVFGDYVAGSNHVLPTNGTARFASALSVRDFVRFVPVVSVSAAAAKRLAATAMVWAAVEGLPGHGAAASLRGPRSVR